MAKLPFRLKNEMEKLFEMESGYVMNFSNASFARFIGEAVNIDIYAGVGYSEYASKANKLRQLIGKESDFVVGKVLNELLFYCKDYKGSSGNLSFYEEQKIEELSALTVKMMGGGIIVELPKAEEETLQTLMMDIQNSLSRNQPTLVLDRLHTFSTKYLRQICKNKGIEVTDPKGNFYPLHSLAGMLRKHYETSAEFQSEFTVLAIQNNIQLFEKFNSIRNNQSYAHDNEILRNIEADFAVKAMANVLVFIDKVENLKQNNIFKSEDEPAFDLPF
jgi:hypothetical protein